MLYNAPAACFAELFINLEYEIFAAPFNTTAPPWFTAVLLMKIQFSNVKALLT